MKTYALWIALMVGIRFPLWADEAPKQRVALSLEQCVDMATKNNLEISQSRLEISKATEDYKAVSTKFFPQASIVGLGFVGAEDLMRGEMSIPGMGAMPLSMVKKGVMASLTVMQPLYNGGQIIHGQQLASIQEQVQQLKSMMTQKEVADNVAQYYWQLVALRGSLSTLQSVDKQLAEVARQTQQFVENGITLRNDLLRVQFKQQEILGKTLRVENGIEITRLLLAQLCGADTLTFDIQADNILNPSTPSTYFVAPQQALHNRAEVALLAKQQQANELMVKMERGKNLPSVAVGASAVYYNVMEKNQTNLVGLASVSVPLTGWWEGHHKIKKAKLNLQQSEYAQKDNTEKLLIGIMAAWNNLNEAYQQITVAKTSVQQAEENLSICKHQYQAGTIGMTDLLDAISLYEQGQSSYIQACAEYQQQIAKYHHQTH